MFPVAQALHRAQRRLEAAAAGREDARQALGATKFHLIEAIELIDAHLTGDDGDPTRAA